MIMDSPRVLSRRDRQYADYTDVVYVGRPTKWGNPFVIGPDGSREDVIAKYEQSLTDQQRAEARDELRGKHLECWCAPLPCHADVLLKIANEEVAS